MSLLGFAYSIAEKIIMDQSIVLKQKKPRVATRLLFGRMIRRICGSPFLKPDENEQV